MKITLYILGVLAIIAGLIPILRLQNWFVRVFDFPRLQLASIIAIIIVLFVVFCLDRTKISDYVLLGGLAIVFGLEILVMIPYSPVWAKQVKDAKTLNRNRSLSLVVANVLMDNREYERLLNVVKGAESDLILLVETDTAWKNAMEPLEKDYPYTHFYPIGNTYGMLLYSRLPFDRMETKFLIQPDIPSFHGEVKLPSGEHVALRLVHPTPPVPTENDSSTERDAELLLVGKEVEDFGEPVIVAGDLNDVAWSYSTTLFQKVSGLLDPRKGRGLFSTYNAKYFLFRWPLDHVFHSNEFELVEMKRLEKTGSDHFPIYVCLQLCNECPAEQKEPDATEKQEKAAEKKIEKGLKSDRTQADVDK